MNDIEVLVINLPERTDRLRNFKQHWSWLGNIRVSAGVRHPTPHSGCGYAHIRAIREGLKRSEVCLILEDDAHFDGDRDEFKRVLTTLAKEDEWDAIVFGVEGDGANRRPQKAVRVHPLCIQLEPSEVPSATHAVMWRRSALPLLYEYEKILDAQYFLPIDRMLFMDAWCHEVWARWDGVPTASDIALHSWKGPSNDLVWNTPRTWICDHPDMVKLIQIEEFVSDHTHEQGHGYKFKEVTAKFLYDVGQNAPVSCGRPAMPLNIRPGRKPRGQSANIVCTARNIGKNFAKESLEVIFAAFDEYKFIVVESNSNDDTVNRLKDFCSKDARRHLISLDGDMHNTRPQRIARARNEYMKHLDTSFSLTVVVDIDDALDVNMDFSEALYKAMQEQDWDCLASNRRGAYYDAWALRSKELGITEDPFDELDKNPLADVLFDKVILPDHAWIQCESAFGCLAVYKTSKIIGRTYVGDKTCEHVPFNQSLRIFIVPYLMSGGKYVHTDGLFTDIVPATRWL